MVPMNIGIQSCGTQRVGTAQRKTSVILRPLRISAAAAAARSWEAPQILMFIRMTGFFASRCDPLGTDLRRCDESIRYSVRGAPASLNSGAVLNER
jgi:hypothetical protein